MRCRAPILERSSVRRAVAPLSNRNEPGGGFRRLDVEAYSPDDAAGRLVVLKGIDDQDLHRTSLDAGGNVVLVEPSCAHIAAQGLVVLLDVYGMPVRTRLDAGLASDAELVILHDYAVLALGQSPYRAYGNARRILAVVASHGYPRPHRLIFEA